MQSLLTAFFLRKNYYTHTYTGLCLSINQTLLHTLKSEKYNYFYCKCYYQFEISIYFNINTNILFKLYCSFDNDYFSVFLINLCPKHTSFYRTLLSLVLVILPFFFYSVIWLTVYTVTYLPLCDCYVNITI